MHGWRARIGYINPGVYLYSQEWDLVMPDGIVWAITTLGVPKMTPEELGKAAQKALEAGQALASREVDIIIIGGTPVLTNLGYDQSKQMAKAIQDSTGVKTVLSLDDIMNSFKKLDAKKINMATPYQPHVNAQHQKIYEERGGFKVVNASGLAIERNVEITNQASDASYRFAMKAFRKNPEADVTWIGCPAWPVLANVSAIEKDTGKPVVTDVTASLYCALSTLGIRGPIKGYGKLLEML